MRSFVALSGVLACSLVVAAEYPIDIKTDLKNSKFFIVEKGGTPNTPTLVVKRVSGTVARYSTREFDCKARTVKTLGRGGSLEELAKSEPEKESYPIADGSIDDQLSKHACRK
jgi:hypothetical protein